MDEMPYKLTKDELKKVIADNTPIIDKILSEDFIIPGFNKMRT